MAYFSDIKRPAEERENLERFVVRLIAEQENVEPDDVTLDYIRRQRDNNVYPKMRFERSSQYGGYIVHDDFVNYSRDEIKRLVKESFEGLKSI